MDPQQYGFNSKLRWGGVRGDFGGYDKLRGRLFRFLSQLFSGPPGNGFVSPWLSAQTSSDWVIAPCFPVPRCRSEEKLRKKSCRSPYDCFDAFAFRLREGLGVWQPSCGPHDAGSQGLAGELRGAPSGARHSRWRVEGPRRTPVQQNFNHVGPQQADLQTEPGGRDVLPYRRFKVNFHGGFHQLPFFFFILLRMGKNKALAHHTSTYFHTRRVSI